MSTTVLDQKLAAFAGYPNVDVAFVKRFGDVVKNAKDSELARINPRLFAEQHGLDANKTLDAFLIGAKLGLFDLQFHLVCPGCGALETTTETWNGLAKDKTWCAVCNVEVPVILDDHVEVTFSPSEAVRVVHLDEYASQETYWAAFFSNAFVRSPELQAFVQTLWRGFHIVHGEKSESFAVDVKAGDRLRIVSVDAHSSVEIDVENGAPAKVVLEVVPAGLAPTRVTLGPGKSEIVVHNRLGHAMGAMVVVNRLDEVRKILVEHPNHFRPFLSAKGLLNHQRFRELFKAQHLDPSLRLKLRSLTLLFTDLKGSTALYDSTGDVTAYEVVQAHFDALMRAVRAHGGAVVKTMGDAVMASFSSPEEALKAADDMMAAMRPVEERVKGLGYSTGLKVGIHEGPALAVSSDDRLDYFGQTVNIAARVQALADAGEIWLTEAVMQNSDVKALTKAKGFAIERKQVALKGVGVPTDVYRLSR